MYNLQIKFLKNDKNGKVAQERYSRGVAFIEFSEHQHALVALRVLNNNPGTTISHHLWGSHYFVLQFLFNLKFAFIDNRNIRS